MPHEPLSPVVRKRKGTSLLHPGLPFVTTCLALLTAVTQANSAIKQDLQSSLYRLAYETYVDGNWEIFVINADGSNPTNLTRTPEQHEHYPQVSPDGSKICFSLDEGEGRDAVRSLCVMNMDGTGRRIIADHAREPFWSPDSKQVGFLPQEYPKFNVIDYYTKGMSFYDLETSKVIPHPNTENLHHLYNPSFAPNGKWIVATVHAGMGYGHAILAIEATGDKIIDLEIPGCRPCISPDGKQLAWGPGDHEVALAPIDLDSDHPKVGPWRLRIQDDTNETYHVDWSPDSSYVSLSRGPASKGDASKQGTFLSACEIVGVFAAEWNLCVIDARTEGVVDLNHDHNKFEMLTSNGASNKESDWFLPTTSAGGKH